MGKSEAMTRSAPAAAVIHRRSGPAALVPARSRRVRRRPAQTGPDELCVWNANTLCCLYLWLLPHESPDTDTLVLVHCSRL